MAMFMVTVKLPKRPDHDPQNKRTGECPASPGKLCSDVTGEHHTVLWEGDSMAEAHRWWTNAEHQHVTRIEEV